MTDFSKVYSVRVALCPSMVDIYSGKFSRLSRALSGMKGVRQNSPIVVSFDEYIFPHDREYPQALEENRYQVIVDIDRFGTSYVLKVRINYLENIKRPLERWVVNIPFSELPDAYIIVNITVGLFKELALEEFKTWWELSTPEGWQAPAPSQKGRT